MKFKRISVLLITGAVMLCAAGCTTYNDNEVADGLDIYYSRFGGDAFAGRYYWNGSEDSMTITVPDEYKGYKINSLGGFFGTGVPMFFRVEPDDKENNGYYYKYTYPEYDPGAEYKELVFTLEIGKNISKIKGVEDGFLYRKNENGAVVCCEVVYNIICAEGNDNYYSKDGRLYLRSDDTLVDLPYPDGKISIVEEAADKAGTTESGKEEPKPESGEGEDVDIGAGIWLARNNGKTPQYYYWFDGNGSGEKRMQENGEEKPFTYSVSGSELTLQYKWSDSASKITVTGDGAGGMEFVWENGSTATLTYLGGFDFDWFTFYSNEELLKMAEAYAANRNGGRTFGSKSAYILDNDMIKIELIDLQDGQPSDAAIFTVDRYTAKGTLAANGGEEPVDLADMRYETVTPAPWSPEVAQRGEMLDSEKHIGIMYLGLPLPDESYMPGEPMFLTDMHYNGAEERFPWVTELPADRLVKTVRGREMYLIIPADKEASVTVRELLYDDDTYSEYTDDTLYQSGGEPFVIICNADRRRSDVRITVTESDGTVYELSPWVNYLNKDGQYAVSVNEYDEAVYDFTDYPKVNGEDDPTARER